MERLIRHSLEGTFRFFYDLIYSVVGSYGLSLILMSVAVTVLVTPFMRYARARQREEKDIQDILKPQIEAINSGYSGAERQRELSSLYKRYSYHPIYSLRSMLGLLIQIPFLMAAFHALKNNGALSGRSFLMIADLSRPDGLIFGINFLPLFMTLINMLSACITPDFDMKNIAQAWIVSLIFLLVLYTSTSALLIFWTCNNLWGLLLNMRSYYAVKRANPCSAMIKNFTDTVGAVIRPILDTHSRFARVAVLAAFLVTCHAVTSLIITPLAQFDFSQAIVAVSLSFCLTMFLVSSIVLKLRGSCLTATAYLISIALAGSFFASFWRPTPLSLNLISEIGGIAHAIARTLSSASGGSVIRVYIICAVLFLSSVILLAIYGRKSGCINDTRQGRWAYTAMAMSAVAPAAFQAWNNIFYLGSYIILVYFSALVLFVFTLYALTFTIWRKKLAPGDIVTSVSVYAFCLILAPSVQAYFMRYGAPTLVFALLFLPILSCSLCRIKNYGKIVLFLLATAIFSLGNMAYEISAVTQQDSQSEETEINNIEASSVHIAEENRESVFLLVYDAMPDIKTLEHLNINTESIRELLSDHDFKIYPDTYSFGGASLPSMGNTFNISAENLRLDVLQSYCAGNSTSFRTFAANGYGTCGIQSDYMTGGNSFVDDSFPPARWYGGKFSSLAVVLRGIFTGEFWFAHEFKDEAFHKFLQENAVYRPGPWFTAMHVSMPGHASTSAERRSDEAERFVGRFYGVPSDMRRDIGAILAAKPDSVIIVIGDHGPWIVGKDAFLGDYQLDEITELMIRDRFGTLIAIRWPDADKAAKYDSNLLVNQDIFPVVFAYLADSPEPLGLMVNEKKAIFRDRVFLDNGVWMGGK